MSQVIHEIDNDQKYILRENFDETIQLTKSALSSAHVPVIVSFVYCAQHTMSLLLWITFMRPYNTQKFFFVNS